MSRTDFCDRCGHMILVHEDEPNPPHICEDCLRRLDERRRRRLAFATGLVWGGATAVIGALTIYYVIMGD